MLRRKSAGRGVIAMLGEQQPAGLIQRELQSLRARVEELEELTGEGREPSSASGNGARRSRDSIQSSASAFAVHEIVTDDLERPVDYIVRKVNRAFAALIGIPAEGLVGKPASQTLRALASEPALEIYGRVARTREPQRFEHYCEGLARYLDIAVFSPRPGQFATIISDLTAKRRAEEGLRLRTEYFKQLFEHSPLGIVLLDNQDRVVECNRGFEVMFGYCRMEVRGRGIDSLIVHEQHCSRAANLSRRVLQGELVDVEAVRFRKDRSPVDVRILAHPIRLGDQQIGIYGIYTDISRRKRDALTRLANRSTFMERLTTELDRARGGGQLTAVLALDLDQLKDVNDTYGLAVGDAVLQAVAERLRGSLRAGASVARLGGDEFGLLQVDLTDIGNAAGLARRLLSVLDRPFLVGDRRIHLSASVGIAVAAGGDGVGAQQLVSQAERALTQAKQEGRGLVKFHAAQMDQEVQARVLLGQELHGAVDRQELYLEYQPQVALPDLRIIGVEALVRWLRADGRVIGPGRFVPVAEASGVIVPIGEWVLRSACRQAVQWQRHLSRQLPIAVNVSAVQFKNPYFVDSVIEALEISGLAPELLELELTERTLVESSRRLESALARLQELGVKLTLDDFGMGYSSLQYLRQLPVQKLKIDRSFVQNLEAEESDAAIVGAIALLGGRLGLKVLAEGVERQTQLERLAAEGCHEIQGFHISPPVAAEKLLDLLSQRTGRRGS